MTRFWLIMLRIICVIQALIAIARSFIFLSRLLIGGGFILLLQGIAFGFIAALAILTFTVYNNNYPDKPIEGRQKKYFNRIFLINFLLIAFLFGFVFRDYHDAILQSRSFNSVSDPLIFFIPFIVSCCILIFHFSILYGLYWLRRQINNNVSGRQFDFEEENI
jgi:cytochrome bd-type quinol oxidase subunit 2